MALFRKGGLGEIHPERPNYYQPEPIKPTTIEPGPPEVTHQMIPPPGRSQVVVEDLANRQIVLTVPKPLRTSVERVIDVAATVPVRLDSGLGNRVRVSLHVIGDNGLWFSTSKGRSVSANNGEFIPGSPVAGTMLGGYWSEDISADIEIWGIADTAGNTRVIVCEYGL
jgi:hypothetical protein